MVIVLAWFGVLPIGVIKIVLFETNLGGGRIISLQKLRIIAACAHFRIGGMHRGFEGFVAGNKDFILHAKV